MRNRRSDPMATDKTLKKVNSTTSPAGEHGQAYLVSGKRVSMRLWKDEQPQTKAPTRRDYETVGLVLAAKARRWFWRSAIAGSSPLGRSTIIGSSSRSRLWRQRRRRLMSMGATSNREATGSRRRRAPAATERLPSNESSMLARQGRHALRDRRRPDDTGPA
jgi:hypothetical protein